MESLLKILFPLVFFVIGITVAVLSLRQRSRAVRAGKWPTTIAQLTDVTLNEHTGDDGIAEEVLLTYIYKVRGVPREGHVLAFGYSSSTSPDYHRRIYDLLKEQAALRVHVNPSPPYDAVVSVRQGTGVLIGIAVGLFFCVFGLGFLLLLLDALSTAVIMGFMGLILLGTIGFGTYWVGLRKNDPLIEDLKICVRAASAKEV